MLLDQMTDQHFCAVFIFDGDNRYFQLFGRGLVHEHKRKVNGMQSYQFIQFKAGCEYQQAIGIVLTQWSALIVGMRPLRGMDQKFIA